MPASYSEGTENARRLWGKVGKVFRKRPFCLALLFLAFGCFLILKVGYSQAGSVGVSGWRAFWSWASYGLHLDKNLVPKRFPGLKPQIFPRAITSFMVGCAAAFELLRFRFLPFTGTSLLWRWPAVHEIDDAVGFSKAANKSAALPPQGFLHFAVVC